MQQNVNVDCFGATHVGQQRETNQDQFLIADLNKHMRVYSSSVNFEPPHLFGEPMGKLMLVADGMGGTTAGDVASALAIKSTANFLLNSMHWLHNPKQPEIQQFIEDLKSAAKFSHQIVHQNAERTPERRGMGTTLTVAYLLWPMLYVLHVGDSRCYIWHRDELKLITHDQTLAQLLYDRGDLDDAEYEQSPFQHVLLNAIGIEDEVDAVVYRHRLTTGDRLLLCTDGVNAYLDDKEIGQVLSSDRNSEQICQQIIDLANERGGRDNITTVVARFLTKP
jgi:protein phosphatase